MTLAWDANSEQHLGGYTLYYGSSSSNYTSSVDVGNQTTYILTGLQPGQTYYLALTAYDLTRQIESGFSNEVSTTIPSTLPVASFSANPTLGTAPLAVAFIDSSTGNITSWTWDFGDGATSSVQNPSHTYTQAGTYSVSLTVSGPGGSHTATMANFITVSPAPPVASFSASPTSGSAPLAAAFNDSSTGNITSWAWNFGDGATSSVQNPSHTYTQAGTYSVSLTVSGPGGSHTATMANFITVSHAPPVASFSANATSGTAPLAVVFTDSSTGNITSWAWDFGDGASSSVQSPGHTYTQTGTYSVSLAVSGPGGSHTETMANLITVSLAAPVASFAAGPTSGSAPLAVVFTDSSTGNITSWAWVFGDGASSSVQNPSHTYSQTGTYSVSLTVSGPGGSDTQTMTNFITVSHAPPVASFSANPKSGTAPLAVAFTDASIGNITSWAWDFGDGASSSAQNPGHTYTQAGTYSVSLMVSAPGGSDTRTMANLITVSTVSGTVITVDTEADELNADGDCSLREALQAANTNSAVDLCPPGEGADEIVFATDARTITLAGTPLPLVTDDLTIIGAAELTVDAANASRVFEIDYGITAEIYALTISNGKAGGDDGGAILNHGSLKLTNSVLAGNTALNGGGIYNDGVLVVTNSTVSGNAAFNGGGIYNDGTLSVINSTLTANRSDTDHSFITGSGGGIEVSSGTVSLRNTIVAGNFKDRSAIDDDIKGTVDTTSSFNLIGADTGLAGISNGIGGNQIGTSDAPIDPGLITLLAGDGRSLIHALLPESAAIDAGDNRGCPATDQRGEPRPVDGDGDGSSTCDMGAYEAQREPLLAVRGNQSSFAAGEKLIASVTVLNPGLAQTVDFYFGVLFPDGNSIVFFTDMNFNSAAGRLSDLSTLSPIARAVNLSNPFVVNPTSFFTYRRTGSEPSGDYVLFLAAVVPGGIPRWRNGFGRYRSRQLGALYFYQLGSRGEPRYSQDRSGSSEFSGFAMNGGSLDLPSK